MANKTKTPSVNKNDVDGLLDIIKQKREEMPKAEMQQVQPVAENTDEVVANIKKELKSQNSKTLKSKAVQEVKTTGRPSAKLEGVEYVKCSPRIPVDLKEEVDVALSRKRFNDVDGKPIRTLDEIVTHALTKLLNSK